MTGVAIALLVVSLLVVWGGLVASIIYLARQSSTEADDEPDSQSRSGAEPPIIRHDL